MNNLNFFFQLKVFLFLPHIPHRLFLFTSLTIVPSVKEQTDTPYAVFIHMRVCVNTVILKVGGGFPLEGQSKENAFHF